MYEVVDWIGKKRLAAALRRPSLAGTGLPERMRSTIFALLGLTAAAGLALVALFAQPGFPLLEPAPLPREPPARQSVADARRLPRGHGRAPSAGRSAGPRAPAEGTGDRGVGLPAGGTGTEGGPAVQAPEPVAETPEGPSGGRGAPGAKPPPAAATPSPAATPVAVPQPAEQATEATASSPPPEAVQAPGNSSSTAAAEHASERGIEASSGSGPPGSGAAGAQAATAPGPGSSGEGNGYAKGQASSDR